MNKSLHYLSGIIILLLLSNIYLTMQLIDNNKAHKQEPSQTLSQNNIDHDDIRKLTDQVVSLYNNLDSQGLYAMFDDQAKVKIQPNQLQEELHGLHKLFGNIEEFAYTHNAEMGSKGDEKYYQLFFNTRSDGAKAKQGRLTLSVIQSDGQLTLYGLRLDTKKPLK